MGETCLLFVGLRELTTCSYKSNTENCSSIKKNTSYEPYLYVTLKASHNMVFIQTRLKSFFETVNVNLLYKISFVQHR